MPVVGSNSWAMRRGAAIILTTVAKGTTMPNDDMIAALGRVVAMLSRAPAWHQQSDDAAAIRALITDLRAGNLVRREDVVAIVDRHLQQWKSRERSALDVKQRREARDYESMAIACSHLADAIAAGAHDASNKSEPNQ